MLVHNSEDILSLKWCSTTEHFIEHHANSINIGTSCTTLALELFWGHIIRRADGTGKAAPGHASRTLEQSDTEINDFNITVLLDHDVLRLDITVKDTMFMAVDQCITNLLRDADRLGNW